MHLYKVKNTGSIKLLLTIIFFAAAVVILTVCAYNLKSTTINEQQKHLEDALNRAVTSCYSTEGRYPESIEYLTEHYGLTIDESKYIITYDRFADNIRPRINIYLRSA